MTSASANFAIGGWSQQLLFRGKLRRLPRDAAAHCRAAIELAAKACFIAVGVANEAELWERGQLNAAPAVALLSAELRRTRPNAEDAVVIYRWLCGFTHGQGNVIAQGPPSPEHAYAAFAFVAWTCAAVAETIIGVEGHATYPTVWPAAMPWRP